MVVVTDRLTSVSAKRCRRQQVRVRLVSPAVSLWLVLGLLACLAANTANAANCDVASGAAAVSACEKELARNPTSIEVRLRYADVLMGQRQYQKAVNILKDTLAMRPGNDKIKQKYRLASSLAEEQQAIDQLSTDTLAAGTRNSVKEILCKTLKGQRAINACDEVLTTDPRNVTALTRLGDELMALNQVVDAVVSYRRAVALDPANPTLRNKLTGAESKMPEELPIIVVEEPIIEAPIVEVEAPIIEVEAPIIEAPIVEVPIIDVAAIAAEKKRKDEKMRLAEEKRKADEFKHKEAERKRKEETKKRLLAEQEQKRKDEKMRLAEEKRKADEFKHKEAERKRKEEAKKLLLAKQEQKSKEAELKAKLQVSAPEVVVKYSNASLANGSTY